jgi:hypothetical protein
MGKKKRKGKCEGCGNSPRVLTKIDSNQWVCVTCLREIRGPQRPKHLATLKEIAYLRQQGFDVQDDLSKVEAKRLTNMTVLRNRGISFNPSATLEELELLERKTYVNHRSINVAGVSHCNPDGTSRQRIIPRCSVGETLVLRHEEHNPADSNAIAVLRQNGEQLGYLSREDAESVLRHLRQGWRYTAVFRAILDDGIRGHWLGAGVSLIYGYSTVDPKTYQKHIVDLIKRFRNAE